MNLRLPPHIAWPLFVVALLVMSITAAVITVVAAHSDGGPQVVENYYQKAIDWDKTQARQAASDALGWQADVRVLPAADSTRIVEVMVRDSTNTPLDRLTGIVRATRPHRTGFSVEAALRPVEHQPGVYRQVLAMRDAGLWDIEIIAVRNGQHFQTRTRKDVQP